MIGTLQIEAIESITGLVEKHFGKNTNINSQHSVQFGRDVFLTQLEVDLLPTSDTIPEEKAYLKFYPVSNTSYYLELTYIEESADNTDTYVLYQLMYDSSFFEQWHETYKQNLLPFEFNVITEQAFFLCPISRSALHTLFNESASKNYIEIFKKQEALITLIRRAFESYIVTDDASQLPACSFLAANAERDKVLHTHNLILSNLDQPFTIRTLSRLVGMNECYLKKGFKAMYGKTIHEFQQTKRIEKAKELLSNGQLTVNEVAFKMGYSSPSHFSTAFKKITGMKPCELLS